jgi:hypothetical protein
MRRIRVMPWREDPVKWQLIIAEPVATAPGSVAISDVAVAAALDL